MSFQDYYGILGVAKSASQEDIKKAFRQLARKFHPDVNKDADAPRRMAEINEANSVLSNPEKRHEYDALYEAHKNGSPFGAGMGAAGMGAGFAGAGFSSAFRTSFDSADFDFFNVFGQRNAQRNVNRPVRGKDEQAGIELDLLDSFNGAKRTIEVKSAGRLRALEVNIPRGVKEGQLIRLAGHGGEGYMGGASGDLILKVRFKPVAGLKIDERNIELQLKIFPWIAALGGAAPCRLPDGKNIEVNIPAGSRSGTKLRLSGRGIPAYASFSAGDLFLVIDIIAPRADTDERRKAWENIAKLYSGIDSNIL